MEGQSTHAISGSGGMVLASELLGSVLEKCCQRRLPAVIAPPDMSTAHGARFAAPPEADNLLRLELVEPAAAGGGPRGGGGAPTPPEPTWRCVARLPGPAPPPPPRPGGGGRPPPRAPPPALWGAGAPRRRGAPPPRLLRLLHPRRADLALRLQDP
jgi:hypothetical protein